MAYIVNNNGASTLSAGITTITQTSVAVVNGALFPSPTGGDHTFITVEDPVVGVEIICIVGRSGNTMTVGIPGSASANSAGRGQEGTVAATWLTGVIVEGRATASVVERGGNAKTAAELANAGAGTHGASLVGNFPVGGITELTVGGALNGLETRKTGPVDIHAATAKTALVDADELPMVDSEADFTLKRVTWLSVKNKLYAGTAKTTPVDADVLLVGDSAASNASKTFTWLNLKAAFINTALTWTAAQKFLVLTETKTAPTISAGALALDLATASVFEVALGGNITALTVSNPPASGTAVGFTLIFTADGTARAVTWPASFKWAGGVAPTLTSTNTKKDFFSFYTSDGGTTYQAFVAGQNV